MRAAQTAALSLLPHARGNLAAGLACAACAALTAAAMATSSGAQSAAASRPRRLKYEARVSRVVRLDYVLLFALSVAAQRSAAAGAPHPGGGAGDALTRFLAHAAPHLLLGFKWGSLSLPLRFVVLPEAARTLLSLAAALAPPRAAPLTVTAALLAAAAAPVLFAIVLLAVGLVHNRMFEARVMPRGLAPPQWQPLDEGLDVLCAFVERATFTLTYEPPLDSVSIGAWLLAASLLPLLLPTRVAAPLRALSLVDGCVLMIVLLLLGCGLTIASKRHLSSGQLKHLQERLGLERSSAEARARVSSLQEVHASAPIAEEELLGAAADKLRGMFPETCAVAVASLAAELSTLDVEPGEVVGDEGGAATAAANDGAGVRTVRRVAHVAVRGPPGAAAALAASLPRWLDEGNADGDDTDLESESAALADDACPSAAAFVAERAASHGTVVAYSDDWPAGMHAFSDWAIAADAAPGDAPRPLLAVTVGVVSAGRCLGFATLTFATRDGFKRRLGDHAPHVTLCEVGRALAAALAATRARAAAATSAAALHASTALANDVFPEHLVSAVQSRMARRARAMGAEGDAADGSTPRADRVLRDYHPAVTVMFTDIVRARTPAVHPLRAGTPALSSAPCLSSVPHRWAGPRSRTRARRSRRWSCWTRFGSASTRSPPKTWCTKWRRLATRTVRPSLLRRASREPS